MNQPTSNRKAIKGDSMDIREEMELRRKFLHRLYDLRREKSYEYPSGYDIGKELDFSPRLSTRVMDSLSEAGQIDIKSSDYSVNITQSGRGEVEKDRLKSSEVEDEEEVDEKSNADPKKIFVVHGRNEIARRAMFDFLRSLGLDPIEWNQALEYTGKASPFIGEVLDIVFEVAQAVIVLMTGDDMARLRKQFIKGDDPDYEKEFTPQARPNVLFEAGLAFGRCSDRTVLVVLEKETTRPFSDISGRHIVRLSNTVKSRMDLVSRLKTSGCEINITGKIEWMHTGDFDVVTDVNSDQEESPGPKQKEGDKEVELSEDQLFILAIITESGDESVNALFVSYQIEFPGETLTEVKYIAKLLENHGLISCIGNIGGNLSYTTTKEGIEHIRKEKEIIKKYRNTIDKHKEMSIKASEF